MIALVAALYFHGVPAGKTVNEAILQVSADFYPVQTMCREDICGRRLATAWPAGEYAGPVDLLCRVLPDLQLVFLFAQVHTLGIKPGPPADLYELCHVDAWGTPLHIHPPRWE